MKSVVVSHGDVDGITSGAIALLEFPNSAFYFSRPSQIHKDLHRIARNHPAQVSVSDIAINEKRFPHIVQALDEFSESTQIFWTDHHPISKKNQKELEKRVNFFHEVGPCAAELVYRRFHEGLPEYALRLALYGAIGDYCDGTRFAINQFENYDKRTLYLEAGLLVQSLQEIDYKQKAKHLVQELSLGTSPSAMNSIVRLAMKATRIESEVFGYVKNNARKLGNVGYVLDMPIRGYRGKSAKFAAYLTESNVGISVKTDDDDVDMSLRRRRLKVDLNKALNTILPGLENAHGGGHPAAAGASMSKSSFPVFLQRLADYIDSNFSQRR